MRLLELQQELNDWQEWGKIAARVLGHYRIHHADMSAAATLTAQP
jgi:hypothetical protein